MCPAVGFEVPVDAIHELTSCVTSSGTSGSKHYLFYAQVVGPAARCWECNRLFTSSSLNARQLVSWPHLTTEEKRVFQVDSDMQTKGGGGGLIDHAECIEASSVLPEACC